MKGLFIPEITAEMFKNGCLESIEALMAEGEIYDIEYSRWIPVSERLPNECSGVLVYCPENKNIFLAYLEIGKWYIFSPRCDEPIDEPIAAWMPLPEPFKPQESEDKEVENE